MLIITFLIIHLEEDYTPITPQEAT